ncbi:MAG: FGGY family carbohydrate kinase, partial [Chloroflexota bacterium]
MPEPLLIGLDIGSRHVKAGVLRADGTVLAVARRPTPLVALHDGGQVHPPADLFTAAEGVVRDAVASATAAGADGSAVAGIGIASVAEAGVPVDAAGEPIGDVLAWHDPRSAPDVARLTAAVPVDRLFARTGLRAEAKHTLAKLAWLRRTEPERL